MVTVCAVHVTEFRVVCAQPSRGSTAYLRALRFVRSLIDVSAVLHTKRRLSSSFLANWNVWNMFERFNIDNIAIASFDPDPLCLQTVGVTGWSGRQPSVKLRCLTPRPITPLQ